MTRWFSGLMLLLTLLTVLWVLGYLQRQDQARWETSLRAVRQVQAMVRELSDSLERLEYWSGQLVHAMTHQALHPTVDVTPPRHVSERIEQALAEQEHLLRQLLTTLQRLRVTLAQAHQRFWVHCHYHARSAQALAMVQTYHQALGALMLPLREAREAVSLCSIRTGYQNITRSKICP